VLRDGEPVEVTTFEFDILETLMRSAGRVVSRDELMEELYGRKATPFDRSVDMHISHLRKKLEGDKPLIKTVRGVGYQFVRSPEEACKRRDEKSLRQNSALVYSDGGGGGQRDVLRLKRIDAAASSSSLRNSAVLRYELRDARDAWQVEGATGLESVLAR
jgi:hypothetical protein